MNKESKFSGDEKQDDNESIYYYMPINQENIKSEKSSKNLEPQDNIKKSILRHLREKENRLNSGIEGYNDKYFQKYEEKEIWKNDFNENKILNLKSIDSNKRNEKTYNIYENNNNTYTNEIAKEKNISYLTTSSSKSKNLSNNLNIIKSNIKMDSKESSPDLGYDFNDKHEKNSQNTYYSENRLIPIKKNKIKKSKLENINLKSKTNNILYQKNSSIISINNYKKIDTSSRQSIHIQNLGEFSTYSDFSKKTTKKLKKVYDDEFWSNSNEKIPLDNTKYKENKKYQNYNNKKSYSNISADEKHKISNSKENKIIDISNDNKNENENNKNKETKIEHIKNCLIVNKIIQEKREKSQINLLENKKDFNYDEDEEKEKMKNCDNSLNLEKKNNDSFKENEYKKEINNEDNNKNKEENNKNKDNKEIIKETNRNDNEKDESAENKEAVLEIKENNKIINERNEKESIKENNDDEDEKIIENEDDIEFTKTNPLNDINKNDKKDNENANGDGKPFITKENVENLFQKGNKSDLQIENKEIVSIDEINEFKDSKNMIGENENENHSIKSEKNINSFPTKINDFIENKTDIEFNNKINFSNVSKENNEEMEHFIKKSSLIGEQNVDEKNFVEFKENKDNKENKENKEDIGNKEDKENKENKGNVENKENKETIESKENIENKDLENKNNIDKEKNQSYIDKNKDNEGKGDNKENKKNKDIENIDIENKKIKDNINSKDNKDKEKEENKEEKEKSKIKIKNIIGDFDVNAIEEKIENKLIKNEDEKKDLKEDIENKEDKIKTIININKDENIENIKNENLLKDIKHENRMKEDDIILKGIRDKIILQNIKNEKIEKEEENIKNIIDIKNSGKKEIINDIKINENNDKLDHINNDNNNKINRNVDQCINKNKSNSNKKNCEKVNRNSIKNKEDLYKNKNKEIKNNKDISKKNNNLKINQPNGKIHNKEIIKDKNDKEIKDIIKTQLKEIDNDGKKGKENKDKNIIINEKENDFGKRINPMNINNDKNSKIIISVENDNNHKKFNTNKKNNKLKKKQNSKNKNDIKKNTEIKQLIKYSSKNIREISTEKILNKKLKFNKNKTRIPQGNAKRFQNKNNFNSNSFRVKNESKSFSKTIEEEDNFKYLKMSKLFKNITDKKELGIQKKPKRFQDKNIKQLDSFNNLNSSQNGRISLNKKLNNKNNIIKTKSFNHKAYIPNINKNKKNQKNNSQKPKNKIIIDSVNRNSYKGNTAKAVKMNNLKKEQNYRNFKIFSKSFVSNNISSYKKATDDNIKIEIINSNGDLDKVGEFLQEEKINKKWNEMNDINENNIINNPRSLDTFSSIVFSIKKDNDIKHQSLSLSKENKNAVYDKKSSLKKKFFTNDNPDERKKAKNRFNNIPEIKNLNQKIEQKSKNIEKIKKLIEYYKKQIVKYDIEISQMNNCILKEEKERENFQIMINFVNVQ